MDSLFLDALACKRVGRIPVWLMRQAGRHLSSYRALRKEHSFLEMCYTPELIAKTTFLPIDHYGVDAAILFSDILLPLDAMGRGLSFEEEKGPTIKFPVRDASEIDKLPYPEQLGPLYLVKEGILQIKKRLKVPLIGFAGAPFTLASYLIEGGSSRQLKRTKQWLFRDPESFHLLLERLTDWIIAFLELQIEAGVNAIQLFDSWANFLAWDSFEEFSLRYLNKIIQRLRSKGIPIILFCKGSSVFAPALAKLKPDGIGIDWNGSISNLRQIVAYPIALQGNLDPDLLYAPEWKIKERVNRLLDEMDEDRGFILNLGHGVPPDVSENSVRTLVECVQSRKSLSCGY